jgi:hypothetical protein
MSLRRLLVALLALAVAGPAHAQVARVFVGVSGNDANVCSNVGTPCRTFGGGVSQVDPDGEVIVTESGSYAGATITKPVKINVASGVVAFSGLPIIVNVTAGDTVVLRGITLKSATPGIGNGITVTSGDIIIEDSVIDGWYYGLYTTAAARISISRSKIRNNYIPADLAAWAGAHIYLSDSELFNNEFGVQVWGGNSGRFSGLQISRGYAGIFCGGTCDISDVRIWDKANGIVSLGAGVFRLNRVEVTGCTVGLSGAATWESYGNNAIRGNTTNFNGAVLTLVALQ